MSYTGRKDAKTAAWAEEKRFDINSLTGRSGEVGGQGQGIGCQQERTSRTDGQRSNVLIDGARNSGGTIDHLIGEYSDQVAIKEQEYRRIEDDIARLKLKIQKLQVIKEELKTPVEAEF